MGSQCEDCLTKTPFATIIATLLCIVGVGVFCGCMYRGFTIMIIMFEEVFKFNVPWFEPLRLAFLILGASMGGLGLMILFLGCLSTGDTRKKVYRTYRGRVGGRISCAIFMGITYVMTFIWIIIMCFVVILTLFNTIAWFQCKYVPTNRCIDYNQFEFMFPSSANEEDRRVCREERNAFCQDWINQTEIYFIISVVAVFLIIMSLVQYLMCLSANYAHIKDHEKFLDLMDIQFLQQDSEMSTLPKDRF